MISEKSGTTESSVRARRAVKLNSETVRALAAQEPAPSVFTATCTFQTTCHSCTCTIYPGCPN